MKFPLVILSLICTESLTGFCVGAIVGATYALINGDDLCDSEFGSDIFLWWNVWIWHWSFNWTFIK